MSQAPSAAPRPSWNTSDFMLELDVGYLGLADYTL
jgi:hypothetical protein